MTKGQFMSDAATHGWITQPGFAFTVVQQEDRPVEGFEMSVYWSPGPYLVIAQVPVYNFTEEFWPVQATIETQGWETEYGHTVAAPGQPWDDGYNGGGTFVLTSVIVVQPVPSDHMQGLPLTLRCTSGGANALPNDVHTRLARLTGVRLSNFNADVQP